MTTELEKELRDTITILEKKTEVLENEIHSLENEIHSLEDEIDDLERLSPKDDEDCEHGEVKTESEIREKMREVEGLIKEEGYKKNKAIRENTEDTFNFAPTIKLEQELTTLKWCINQNY